MKKNGFTLIELLIVVAIIGVLTSIALPNYWSFIMKAKRTDAILMVSSAFKGQIGYYAANDTFFATDDCDNEIPGCLSASDEDILEINQTIGLGDVIKTTYGYSMQYAWADRPTLNDPFLNFKLDLMGNLDSDVFSDVVVIHYNYPGYIVLNYTNGRPIVHLNDIQMNIP